MYAERKAMLLALFLGLLAWLMDACVHAYQPGAGSVAWLPALFPPAGPVLVMRVVTFALFLLFGLVTGRVLRQRRLAQSALRSSCERYGQLFDHAPDALWELDAEGRVLKANLAMEALTGLPAEQLKDRRCSEVLKSVACGTERCPLRIPPTGGQPQVGEILVQRPDERQALCQLDASVLRDEQGRFTGLVEGYRNLTELRRTEARFEALVETTGDGVTIIDPDGVIVYANSAFCRALGYEPEEVLGHKGREFTDETNKERLRDELERRHSGVQGQYELSFTARDGRQVPMAVTATALTDEQGEYSGSFAVMKDVTEQKLAAERMAHLNSVLLAIRNVNQLITREQDRSVLLQQACDCLTETRGYRFAVVLLTDAEGAPREVFGAGEKLTELGAELTGMNLWHSLDADATPPEPRVLGDILDSAGPTLAADRAAGQACLATRLEYGGRGYGLLVVSTPATMAESADEQSLFAEVAGDLAFALYALDNEEERKRYQVQVAAERDRSRRMMETAGALIISLDFEGRVTFFNRCCQDTTGYQADEVVGRQLWEILIPERQVAEVQEICRGLSQGGSLPDDYENVWITKDGQERLIAWRNATIVGPDGPAPEIVGIGLDVTEHRAAELAVLESVKRYRLLFNVGNDAVFVFGLEENGQPSRFIEANSVACELFGYSREELRELTPEALDHPDDTTGVPDMMAELQEHGHALFEQRHVTRDGTIIPMEVSTHLFLLDGRPAVLSIARDITERQQQAERLAHLNSVLLAIRNVNQLITRERNRDELLAKACECLTETRGYHIAQIQTRDEDGTFTASYGAGYGYARQDFETGRSREHLWEAVTGSDGEARAVILGAEQAQWNEELRAEWEAGRTCMAIRLEYGGRRYGYLATSLPATLAESEDEQSLFEEVAGDIAFALYALETETERRAAQDSLQLTQFSVDHASDAVFWTDAEGRIVYVNQAACGMLGYEREALEGMWVWEVDDQLPEERWPSVWERVRERRTYSFETTQRTREGLEIPVELTINYLEYNGREYSFSFGRDISRRKRAQAELQRLNDQYRLLVESQLVETFIVQRGRLVFANEAMHERMEYPPDGLVGMDPVDLVTPAAQDALLAWNRRREAGEPVAEAFETQVVTRNGTMRWVQVWAQDTPDFEGAPAIIGHMVDVTEARELRGQLEHSQRLESLGTLAGGVAHEFNNVLQAILMNASLLQLTQSPTDGEGEKLKTIIERSEYGARLTDQLLTFSRRTPVQYGPVNLNESLEETQRLLLQTIPRQIRIRCDRDDSLWTVWGDGARLKQVFINLGLNARDAMPAGGELVFETQNVMLSGAALKTMQKLRPGPHVLIKVRDTGAGMDQQTLSRAFEPFFTTKGVGRGTGLGLSIVHGIIDTHGGHIRITSQVGTGTTFHLYLPAQPEVEVTPEDARHGQSPQGAAEHVLLVDDEDEVVRGAREALSSSGYRVTTASSGAAALDLVAARPTAYDLVILDLVMPGLSGQETLARLREAHPHLKVLIASGYMPQMEKDSLTVGACGYLDKPFTLGRLLETVRGVLDQPLQGG